MLLCVTLLYLHSFLLAVLAMKKGQAFEVFRLLIAAVVAGAILMVLLQILGGFVTPTQDPQKVAAQFVKDLSTYGGTKVSDPITFKKGATIDLGAVSREAAMPTNCVTGGVSEALGSNKFEKAGDLIQYSGSANYVARVWVRCTDADSTSISIPRGGSASKPSCKDSDIWCAVAIIPR